MLQFLILMVALIAVSFGLCCPAFADKRIALVVGNSKYMNEGSLANPGNDAREVSVALKRIGFDDVQTQFDADLKSLQAALALFARKADGADFALLYYSGHGIEVDRRNFLIPTDAKLSDAADVDFEAVPLELALAAVDRAQKMKLIVLDACRNNPFRARMVLKQGRRSVGRGFAPVSAPAGTLVVYSARDGTEAEDGLPGGTSPFTAAFLKFVEQPRLEVQFLFRKIRDEVVRTTGRQEPFMYGSLGGEEVYFAPGVALPPTAQIDSKAPVSQIELVHWESVKDTKNIAELETFISEFPTSKLTSLAKVRLAALKSTAAASHKPGADKLPTKPPTTNVKTEPAVGGKQKKKTQFVPSIIGGEIAKLKDWPWLATLRYTQSDGTTAYLCNGAAIGARWVLTGGGCTQNLTVTDQGAVAVSGGSKQLVDVILGVDDLADIRERDIYKIARVVNHPLKSEATNNARITLLELASDWWGPILGISPDLKSDEATRDSVVRVAGFGGGYEGIGLKEIGPGAKLNQVALPLVTGETCSARYPIGTDEMTICAGYEEGRKDSCQGSSGTPLVGYTDRGCAYQIGVMSWGEGCARPKTYSVSERVSAFKDWLKQHVKDLQTMNAEQLVTCSPR